MQKIGLGYQTGLKLYAWGLLWIVFAGKMSSVQQVFEII
jgi:hypothetical protein